MSGSLFNALSTRHLRMDFMGGLTAAVVALPLALAFGVASGAGPAAGLYGAIFVGFFAALCTVWWHLPSSVRSHRSDDCSDGGDLYLLSGQYPRWW